MIPPAALPVAGAAPRLPRAAAGRRVLQASLLVAGLFALGLLCGEQAHAADGGTPTALTTPVASAAEQAARPVLTGATGALTGLRADNSAGRKRQPQVKQDPLPKQQPQAKQEPQPNWESQGSQEPQPSHRPQLKQERQPNHTPHLNQKPQPNHAPHLSQKPQPQPQTESFRKPPELGPPPQERPAPSAESSRAPASAGRADTLVTGTLGSVVRRVAGSVVRPVGDLAETLTGRPATSLPVTLPALPALPALPSLPALPAPPAVPSLPSVPSLPGPLTPPAAEDGKQVPRADPAHPVRPGTVGAPAPDPAAPHAAGREPGSAAVPAYGPAGPGADVRAGAAHHGHGHPGHRRPTVGPAPARQAPAGDSSGAPGDRPAVDGGVSRHGDAYAVAPDHRAPLMLVSAASESVTAAGTRDRYRDIPLFPG